MTPVSGAGRGRRGHGDDGGLPVDGDSADEPEIDDIHTQVGVYDVGQRLMDRGDPLVRGICRDIGRWRQRNAVLGRRYQVRAGRRVQADRPSTITYPI